MSDFVDQAQEYIDFTGEVSVQAIRELLQAEGSDICLCCSEPIPAERRRIVPWAETCTTCQSELEHNERVGAR